MENYQENKTKKVRVLKILKKELFTEDIIDIINILSNRIIELQRTIFCNSVSMKDALENSRILINNIKKYINSI